MALSTTYQTFVQYIVIFATVLFAAFELLVAGGYITLQQTTGFLGNLTAGGSNWYLNPIVWLVVITVLVNFAGFVENVVILKQSYDIKKFAETFFKYLPFMVIFSQIPWANIIPGIAPSQVAATNIAIYSAISAAIDILTRAFKSLSTTIATAVQAQAAALTSTGIPQPSTPSTIPPIPSVPATVILTGLQALKTVTVDGKAYAFSSIPTTLKAGEWTSEFKQDKNATEISIAFPDYAAHGVSIQYNTKTLNLTLSSGQSYPT